MRRFTPTLATLAVLALVLGAWPVAACAECASCGSPCPESSPCHPAEAELTAPDCRSVASPEAAVPVPSPVRWVSAPLMAAAEPSLRPDVLGGRSLAVERTRPALRAVDRCNLFSSLLI